MSYNLSVSWFKTIPLISLGSRHKLLHLGIDKVYCKFAHTISQPKVRTLSQN